MRDDEIELGEADLDGLYSAGLLKKRVWERDLDWSGFLGRGGIVVGGGMLLAGVMFFFAANWRDMPRLARFGVLEVGIVLLSGLAIWKAKSNGLRAIGVMGASVLLGVLMAVFGQEYQTGADACDLFLWWAVLMLPWVIAGRFMPLWALWVVILVTGIDLYWTQVGFLVGKLGAGSLFLVTGLVPLVLAVVRELLKGKMEWMRGRVWRYLGLGAALVAFTCGAIRLVWFDEMYRAWDIGMTSVVAVVWLVVAVGCWVWFSTRDRDLGMLALVLLSGCAVAVGVIFRGLEAIRFDDVGGFLLGGIATVGVFAVAGMILMRMGKRFREVAG